MIEKEYNLLDERWIRVLGDDGAITEVSLLEIFARAHLYKRLANETETLDVVILRLLLAIMYAVFSSVDADGNPAELTYENALARWRTLRERGSLPYPPIEEYLEHFRERFYLFHPETPFYQIPFPDSRKCTEYSAPKLIGDISQSENKSRLFFARTDSDRIGNPEAARWLLHLNAFDDTSAKPSVRGADMPSTGAGWLGKLGLIFSEGHSIFQTLLLNFVLLNTDGRTFDRGTPIWESPVRTDERVEIPLPGSLAELYTMQSRRLLLTREDGAVTGYKLLGGDFFDKEDALIEQMTLWRRNSKNNSLSPMRHRPSRQLWRDFSALIAGEDGAAMPGVVYWNEVLINEEILGDIQVKFSAASIGYGDKDFFVDDMFSDSVSINSYLLSNLGGIWRTRIIEHLKNTDEAVQGFGRFVSDLALAEGTDNEKNNIARIRGAAREEAYAELDSPFRSWLAGLTGREDMDKALFSWNQMARNILYSLANERLNDVSDAAFVGRQINKNFITAAKAEIYLKASLNKTLPVEVKGGR